MTRYELQQLSRIRAREAKALLEKGHFSGAYYLLGYAVECALKACIARRIKRHDFPNLKLAQDSHTHDLQKLLNAAGLKDELTRQGQQSPALKINWATVKDWSVDTRYQVVVLEKQARDLYIACTDSKTGVLSWLKQWW